MLDHHALKTHPLDLKKAAQGCEARATLGKRTGGNRQPCKGWIIVMRLGLGLTAVREASDATLSGLTPPKRDAAALGK